MPVTGPAIDRRKQHTRAALLRAFVELLLERGYEAVSVTQVADRADVGRSTLYEHFRTKDDLLRASLQAPFRALATALDPAGDARAVTGFLEHIRAHAAIARLLLAQPMRSRIARVLAAEIGAALAPDTCPRPSRSCARSPWPRDSSPSSNAGSSARSRCRSTPCRTS